MLLAANEEGDCELGSQGATSNCVQWRPGVTVLAFRDDKCLPIMGDRAGEHVRMLAVWLLAWLGLVRRHAA